MALSVLQVIGDGTMGGGTTAVLQLATGLAAQGATVRIATQGDTELAVTAASRGIAVSKVDFTRRLASPLASLSLQNIVAETKPDVIHAHGARAGLPCALLRGRVRAALAYTVHGFHYTAKRPVIRTLARWSERLCIAAADKTVFVSHADERQAQRDRLLSSSDYHRVIYNGAAIPRIAAGSPPASFDVAFLGRLHHQKNPLLLAEIARLAPQLSFLVIGDGPLGASLRARVAALSLQHRFTFLGSLGHADALQALASARTLVLPSLWEGLPMAVIEAMHLGLPIVATDTPGLREMIVEGETGHLVASGNAQGFADRLTDILNDGANQAAMAEAAKRRAAALFSLEQQLAQHVDLYRRLITARQPERADIMAAGPAA